MKLYHYTSLDSLALILKTKTLLFNRLDCVDDMEEGAVESGGVKLGHYIFVSCWTESVEESIPLWKMYAGDGMGVRIGLEHNMFKQFYIENPKWGGQQWQGNGWFPLPPSEFEKEYMVLPIFTPGEGFFYRHIEYVDSVAEKTKNAFRLQPDGKGKADVSIELGEIGRYKHKRWGFQEETRFVLNIFPFNPFQANPNDISTIAIQAYLENRELGFTKYFMNLDENVLGNIEITLSPNANEGHRIMVEALVKQYAPNAIINDSRLGTLVKL